MAQAPSAPSQPTGVRWLIFGLACAASWLLYLHRYAWGIVKPYYKQENPEISDYQLGWLDSAFNATYAVGQIPCGMAGDRFGTRSTLSLFTLLWSLAVGGVALTHGFWRLIVARAAFGLAQAGAYPAIIKITHTWFPLSIRTSVQGVVSAMGRIGAAFAPVIIATFLMGMLGLSWQTALLVLTAPGVLLAVALWVALRNRPSEHPWTNRAEQELLGDGPPAADSALTLRAGVEAPAARKRPALKPSGAAFFSLGMLCFYIFASTFQDQFFVYWLPLFLKEGRSFDATMMGLFAPLPLLGGACGGILGGVLNDVLIRRLGNRRWARSIVGFSGKFVAGCLVILSIQFEDGRLTMVVLVAARVFSDWSMPTQWAACTDMGGRASATVFAIVNTCGAVGGFVAGPVLGYVLQEYGWDGIFYGVAGMCVAAAVSWLFIDCTRRLVDD